jgi:hypothetical protein
MIMLLRNKYYVVQSSFFLEKATMATLLIIKQSLHPSEDCSKYSYGLIDPVTSIFFNQNKT